MTTKPGRETRRCRASLVVALPAHEAFELFTPEGERRWAHGWQPTYVSLGTDRSQPGTVFLTQHDHRTTTWLVVGRDAGKRLMYARVDDLVGSVEVVLRPGDAARTTVDVEYVLTPLTSDAERRLADFASDYPAYIAGWQTEIEHYLSHHDQHPG